MVKQIRRTHNLKTIARPKKYQWNADTRSSRWQRTAKAFLQQHPFCVFCHKRGELVPAEVVDHIVPHRGDCGLLWDQDNWQSLCKRCHDSDKQKIERQCR